MTVSRCLDHAMRIAKLPRPQWADAIKSLPAECQHPADCTAPGCREYNAAYLRMQWRILERMT